MMSGMAAPKKKSVFAILAAAALVAVGSWAGVYMGIYHEKHAKNAAKEDKTDA